MAAKRLKITVGETEKNIILEAYLHKSSKGWNEVLNKVIELISKEPINPRLLDYYTNMPTNTSVGRIQRIVRKEMKNSSLEATSNTTVTSAVDKLTKRQIQYATKRTPEERFAEKLSEFVYSSAAETEEESTENVASKKQKTTRETTMEAHEAHTTMCKQATSSMSLVERVLTKLESKLDDL